jgi:hypothetical protein|uniref:Sulfotransferase n=1 Tax=Phaeodactylum tricornutum TaxID=2850 RepID=A0A8J9S8N4_PHATR
MSGFKVRFEPCAVLKVALAFAALMSVMFSVIRSNDSTRTAEHPKQSISLAKLGKKTPVLVMGLPRSGSASLHEFFRCNNVKSSHFCCGTSQKTSFACEPDQPTCGRCVHQNLNQSLPAFQGCGNFSVYSQFDVESGQPFSWFLPQHFALPLLHESFPEAVWILNRRADARVWARGVLHWYSVSRRVMNAFGLQYHHPTLIAAKIYDAPVRPLTEDGLIADISLSLARAENVTEHKRRLDELTSVYEAHLHRVRAFVTANPSHSMLEIDVDDPTSGETLSAFFGGARASCWVFDAQSLDNDWKKFSLQI